ncbi:hypothetical protein HA052_21645 [Chromobacterium haemolyticum]|uniref:Uncharacterized protein n=1 Tax=Chromobacterium fluminis TaxID=3044269 RepID=A0ABX0LEY3_9NEIS|nr:hypothetical protein [Chromobacterium haemolyticum]NHR07798.1 hypothetical protein [Chromobacterium haemolyticum]
MKKYILAGNIPYFGVIILCAISFYLGKTEVPTGKYAIVEKGAVIFDAVMNRPGMDEATLNKEVSQPILAVLKKYSDEGYVVIDTGRDERGNMHIAALPGSTIDITSELRAAVKNSDPIKVPAKEKAK